MILLALLAHWGARGETPAPPPDVERWIAQLASDDWKLRQQATDHLVALGDDALPRLTRLAQTAADTEVRTRAQAAIRQIEDNHLTGTSPITLRLTNASAAQALAEIARQARAPIATDPPDLLRKFSKPVSLTVEHRPFWEVMQSLSAQTELEVTGITRHNREIGLGVTRGGTDWMDKPIVLAGPLLIRADRLTRVSTVTLKPPRDASEEFAISLTVFAEPKLKVLDYSQTLRLEQVTDDRGNSLLPASEPDAVPPNADVFGNQGEGNTSHWDVGATLHHPKGAGTRIERFRASTTLLVQTRSARLDVPLSGARNVTRTLDGVRVTVRTADANRAELCVYRDGRTDAEWFALRSQLNASQTQLLNDRGQVVGRAQGSAEADDAPDGQRLDLRLRFAREPAGADGGGGSGDGRKAASEATRMVWEFPVEARELVVPFEFRGLPIP